LVLLNLHRESRSWAAERQLLAHRVRRGAGDTTRDSPLAHANDFVTSTVT
jgi:hypothetical protein